MFLIAEDRWIAANTLIIAKALKHS